MPVKKGTKLQIEERYGTQELGYFHIVYILPVCIKTAVKVKVKSFSHVRFFVIPWTVAYQAPPSMGISRQECWSGLPFPFLGDLPNPGIEPGSPAL